MLVSAERETDAVAAAQALAAAVAAEAGECERLGPAPAPLPRLRGRHRQQLLLKSEDEAVVRRAARAALGAASRLREGVQAAVDVRPWSML